MDLVSRTQPFTIPKSLYKPGMVSFSHIAILKGGELDLAKGSVVQRSGTWYAVFRDCGIQKWERAGSTKKSAEKLLAKRMNQIII